METTGDVTATCTVAALPGLAPRLLREELLRESEAEGEGEGATPEPLDAYVAGTGYQDGPADRPGAGDLLDTIEQSGLRGRGGAAFPFAVKARAVRRVARWGQVPVVVANGEEGEPASVKDRWLLRNRPHLVLDGLRLAAAVVGADQAYVYVSDPAAARSVAGALHDAELAGLLGPGDDHRRRAGVRRRRGDRRGASHQRRPGQAGR